MEDEQRWEDAIEDALRTAPLEPVPLQLFPLVMRRVKTTPYRPHFQVPWLDIALGLFAIGMVGVLWLAAQWLPPAWLNYMRLELSWLWMRICYLDMDGYGMVIAGLTVGGCLLASLWAGCSQLISSTRRG